MELKGNLLIEEFLEEVNRECKTNFQLVSKKRSKNNCVRFSCEDPEHGKIEGFVEPEEFGGPGDRQLRRLFARRLPKKLAIRVSWPILGNPSERSKNLPRKTGYFYRQFASGSTKTFSYHPADMTRFYRFVIAAHRGGAKLTEGDVKELLVEDGFKETTAEHLATIYNSGREILKLNRRF